MLLPLVALALAAPAAVHCDAPRGQRAKVQEYRRQYADNPAYDFAVRQAGRPTKCSGRWRNTADGIDAALTFRFADGSTLILENSPPENGMIRFLSARPLVENDVRRMLEGWVAEIDWKKAPDSTDDAALGTTTRTWWTRDEGDNIGVGLITRGVTLIGFEHHYAL